MEERLQKFLARAGVASRRNAEKLILEGKVRVNGIVIKELGRKSTLLKIKFFLKENGLDRKKERFIIF